MIALMKIHLVRGFRLVMEKGWDVVLHVCDLWWTLGGDRGCVVRRGSGNVGCDGFGVGGGLTLVILYIREEMAEG